MQSDLTFNNNQLNYNTQEVQIPLQLKEDVTMNFLDNSESEIASHSIEDMIENLAYLIETEKTKIKVERVKSEQERDKFLKKMNIILLNFEIEKKIYKDNCAKAHWLFESTKNNNDKLIDLDVGGTEKIITTLKTLTKFPKSALGAMFSGKFHLKTVNNRIFIDRDASAFIYLLQYLRNGVVPNQKK